MGGEVIKKPPISAEELVKMLTDVYRERCIDRFANQNEAWLYAGKRSLVRYLAGLYEVPCE